MLFDAEPDEAVVPPPSIEFGQRRVPTFFVCGLVGFATAAAVSVALAVRLELSVPVFGALIAGSAVAFFVLAHAMLFVLGSERLVYYHHELLVLALSALLLRAFGRPLLPYLDVVSVALGVFLVFGRLGCFSAGCCHGVPARHGVRYRAEHARAGFSPCFVGVPLLPVQLVEACAVLGSVIAAIVALSHGSRAGEVMATQLVLYAAIRCALETLRGDDTRPMWRGFSEAQWTSLVVATAVVVAEQTGRLPPVAWHVVVVAALACAFSTLALGRLRRGSAHRLVAPVHVHEIAEVLTLERHHDARSVEIRTTSLGVRWSSCNVQSEGVAFRVHTVSGVDGAGARALAGLVSRLEGGRAELREARPGVFHVIVRRPRVALTSRADRRGS